jgi:hypothetical protein
MKTKIFVRESGGKYGPADFALKPIDIETIPRVGEYAVHPKVQEWLRVDLVAVSIAPGANTELYVTKVSQRETVTEAESNSNEDDELDRDRGL